MDKVNSLSVIKSISDQNGFSALYEISTLGIPASFPALEHELSYFLQEYTGVLVKRKKN